MEQEELGIIKFIYFYRFIEAVAYWDGVRHMWLGEENYWYCCDDMSVQIEAFEYIRSLTSLYCNINREEI